MTQKIPCWPGCLAIVRCHNQKYDNGKVVEVLRRARPGKDRFTPSGIVLSTIRVAGSWWVRGVDLHFIGNKFDGVKEIIGGQTEVAYADGVLIPLMPPPGSVTDSEVSELFSPSPAKESEKV